MTSPVSTDAIAAATGLDWDAWVAHLEAEGGAALDHRGLVAAARRRLAHIDNPGWWAQSVAVAFEQHLGRRAPGQRQDGTFEASVSRTHGGTLDQAIGAWRDIIGGRRALGGTAFDGDATETATPAYRRWRVSLADGTRVRVQASLRGDRALLTATWERLPDADARDSRRATLQDLLAQA